MATAQDVQQALVLAYEQTIGRDPTAAELTLNQRQVANGTSVATLRAYLANSGYADIALTRLYADVVGRSPRMDELESHRSYLVSGGSLGALRDYFSITNEAAGKLQRLYTTELNRAISPNELVMDERMIAAGSSLAAIRTYLSTSAEAVRDLTAQFKTALGTAPAPSDLQSAERALAGGADQPAAVAGAPGTAAFVNAEYRLLMGVAPTTTQVSAIKYGVQDHLATPYPGYAASGYSLAAQATAATASATQQFLDNITKAYQAAVGKQLTPIILAAAQSELGANPFNGSSPQDTVTLAILDAQITELSGGAPPQVGSAGTSVDIRPQTVSDTPGFIYGLPNNIAFLTPLSQHGVSASFQGPGSASLSSFDTRGDVLQIPIQQAASFGALTLTETTVGGPEYPQTTTHIRLHSGATIDLTGITENSLTPANFQFV